MMLLKPTFWQPDPYNDGNGWKDLLIFFGLVAVVLM